MFEMEEEKIIQIMPAPENMYLNHPDDLIVVKIVALGLTNHGDTIPIDMTEGDALTGEATISDGTSEIVWLTFEEFRDLQEKYQEKYQEKHKEF